MEDQDHTTDDAVSNDNAPITRRGVLKTGGAGLGSLALFGGMSGTGAAANSINTPRLSTSGNQLVDPDGNKVVLRGVNVEDPYWATHHDDKTVSTKIDEATSGGWYARVIRLPCEQKWIPDAGGVQSYVDNYVDPLVDQAEQRGVYLILDWHEIADWDNSTVHSNLEAFWNYVAPKYADREHVIYELFNEPVAPGDNTLSNWKAWRDTAQPWVDSIRADAPETPIIIGSPRYCQITEHADDAPFSGNDLIYAAHTYPIHYHETVDMNALASAASNVPMIMSEWGFVNDDSQPEHMVGTRDNYGMGMKDWLTTNDSVSWTPWCYSRQYGPKMFDDNWNLLSGNDYQGQFVKDFLYDERNNELPSSSSGDTTAPSAPSNLSSPAKTDSSVDLDWDASSDTGGSGLDHYNVYVDSGFDQQVAAGTTSATVSGLSSDTSYDFHVTAVDGAGNESGASNTISVTTNSGSTSGPTINSTSSAPSIDGTKDSVWDGAQALSLDNDLVGTPSNSDVDATVSTLYDANNVYVLFEVTDDGDAQDSSDIYQDDSVEVYLDVGNDKSTSYGTDDYQYQFRRDGSGFTETKHGATSGVSWATSETSAGYNVEVAFPHSTTGASPTDGSDLGFDAHVNDDDDGGNRDGKIAWNDTTDDAWQDPSVFGTLTYDDTSDDGSGDTTAPSAPSNLSSPAKTDSSVDLDWDASSDSGTGVDHYNVYVDSGLDHQVAAGTTSTTVSGLSSDTSYDFHVTAVDGAGNESGASNTVTVTTDTGSTSGGNAFSISGDGWDAWDAGDGNTWTTFHWAYESVSGDATLVARVTNLTTDSDPYSTESAGIHIQGTTDSGDEAGGAILLENGTGGLEETFWSKDSGGVQGSRSGTASTSLPRWLKLERSGDTVTGYVSSDGSSWSQVGSATLGNIPTDAHIGIGVSSGRDALETADFDNVSGLDTWSNASVGGASGSVTEN